MLLYTSLRRLELWRSSLRTLLGISWFRAMRHHGHCHLPLWANRRAASLPRWVEFNCLRSPAMGKAARLLIYWQDAACRLVIPVRQVALLQLYKYHHQSGKAVSSKLVWKQHNSGSCFCVSLYQGNFMASRFWCNFDFIDVKIYFWLYLYVMRHHVGILWFLYLMVEFLPLYK